MYIFILYYIILYYIMMLCTLYSIVSPFLPLATRNIYPQFFFRFLLPSASSPRSNNCLSILLKGTDHFLRCHATRCWMTCKKWQREGKKTSTNTLDGNKTPLLDFPGWETPLPTGGLQTRYMPMPGL